LPAPFTVDLYEAEAFQLWQLEEDRGAGSTQWLK
jgi:hypothetical protein